jgi:hypothetical protein
VSCLTREISETHQLVPDPAVRRTCGVLDLNPMPAPAGAPADQPHAVLFANDQHAITVVLDFVNPVGARGNIVGFGREGEGIQPWQ